MTFVSWLLVGTLAGCGDKDGGVDSGTPSDGGAAADGGTGTDGGATTPPADDTDRDGLSNDEEVALRTDPELRDTDGDGQTDAAEVAGGSDPLSGASTLAGLYAELGPGATESHRLTTTLRLGRADIAFVIDTSAAGPEHVLSGLSTQLGTIDAGLEAAIASRAWGLATYEDYAYGSFGLTGIDLPFRVEREVTTSTASMGASLSAVLVRGGGDSPEAGMEALYQALSGAGYDQDCDGVFDGDTDLLPYLADATDPFGGTAGQAATSAAPGSRGGLGFRDLSLPIVVYSTDNLMRDPDAGYGSPGGCPGDAGGSDVLAAAAELQAVLLGVCASTHCTAQMEELAPRVDLDGDGDADEPLVLEWATADAGELRDGLLERIEAVLSALSFERIDVVLGDDPHGFVTGAEATGTSGDDLGSTATVQLDLAGTVAAQESDQVFVVELELLGDDTLLVGQSQVVIVVPNITL